MTAGGFALKALRQPSLWLVAALALAIVVLPHSAPLFGALFPDDPRPVYTRASFLDLTLAHCGLVLAATLVAAILGVGLAVFVTRPSGRDFAVLAGALASIGQTIPPVAALALAVPALGYGAAPTLAALALCAVLPILEGALTGLRAVSPAALEAARGMGFAPGAILARIELPLAAPFVLEGLRSATIINIGTAAIGSTVGALTLGSPIVEGLAAANPAYVLQGALLVALLTLAADRAFEAIGAATRV